MDLSTLLLSRSEVEKLVSMKDAIEALRSVFMEHSVGKTKTYPRVHIPFDEYEWIYWLSGGPVDNLGMSISEDSFSLS